MPKSNRATIHEEMTAMFGRVPTWSKQMPDTTLDSLWTQMRDLQFGNTFIPNKYKELIGLAVSGATRCRYCALFHTEAARLAGATDAEIAEASAIAAHTMGASTYLNAMQVDYEQFRKETLDIVKFIKSQPQQQQQPHA